MTTAELAQRIDALAKVIESAGAAAKAPPIDPWQDTKSVVLNIIANRIDSWLFGDGKGTVGVVAQIVAVLALAIALARFLMAVAMLNPATPPTTWGKFKAWTRKSRVVRGINVAIGALAVAFTGAAFYVVMSARAMPDVSLASVAALRDSLTACQASISKAPQFPQQEAPPQQDSSSFPAQAVIEKISKSCETAIRATDTHLIEIEGSLAAIEAKQPWTTTKILAFLAWAYLLIAVTYLFWQRLTR